MREIVLDTETTGFEPSAGHRIVEIGAVELWNHLPTGQTFHEYINPERPMPQEAFAVHGLGDDFLRDKPVFEFIGQKFLDFVGDAKLVIHNAAFDMKFLNAELGWLGLPQLPWEQAIDTLAMARQRFPGSPATLDALCRPGTDRRAAARPGAGHGPQGHRPTRGRRPGHLATPPAPETAAPARERGRGRRSRKVRCHLGRCRPLEAVRLTPQALPTGCCCASWALRAISWR